MQETSKLRNVIMLQLLLLTGLSAFALKLLETSPITIKGNGGVSTLLNHSCILRVGCQLWTSFTESNTIQRIQRIQRNQKTRAN